jgi:hypothetical protein
MDGIEDWEWRTEKEAGDEMQNAGCRMPDG